MPRDLALIGLGFMIGMISDIVIAQTVLTTKLGIKHPFISWLQKKDDDD